MAELKAKTITWMVCKRTAAKQGGMESNFGPMFPLGMKRIKRQREIVKQFCVYGRTSIIVQRFEVNWNS